MALQMQSMIFDFDGTLAHLTIDFQHMRRMAEQAAIMTINATKSGLTEKLLQDDTLPVLEWLEHAHKQVYAFCPATAETLMENAHQAIVNVEVDAAKHGDLFPWTRKLLSTLKEQGVAPCIITRNCTRAVHTVFPDVMEYCSCLLTRDDVPDVKPHPDHLIRALAATDCQPDKAMMIGDHPLDIVTGKAGGTLTAGVLSGYDQHEALAAEDPDYIAANALALYEILRPRYWPQAPVISTPFDSATK